MIVKKIRSVSIIGSGNVAFHMTKWLHERGYFIESIWSRSYNNALQLAKQTGTTAIEKLDQIPLKSDLYLLCISDDALPGVIQKLSRLNLSHTIVAHTSGSTPSNVFDGYFSWYGVIYPLQTFSKTRELSPEQIPILITGNNDHSLEMLGNVAKDLSQKSLMISDEQRLAVHIAAVFTNNFSNHLFCIANKLLSDHGISFNLLHPLIRETIFKALETNPCYNQTGPAVRNDRQTIEKHLVMLEENQLWKEIYTLLSQSIIKNKI